MDLQEYKKKALSTDHKDYSQFHTGESTARLDYGTIGMATCSAKILNFVKKTKMNAKPLDREAITEELGDLLWYMNLTIDELGITFEDVMKNNIEKISKIYPTK
ncbi:MAG TPA: nucleoside triphosphate pyrophosphohydrolase family protein [Candidatus Dojkabacteria bacterium]|nr:nucleoside triphosphate pyrophosphohydrolase family protein [Candidatus Dojkabacteria bacterium]